jgi:hypothetical protein
MSYVKAREAFHAALQEHDGQLSCQSPDVDVNDWFAAPNSAREVTARKRCMDCPIYFACQEYALEAGVPNGTWGGMDERTRERIWKTDFPTGKPQHFNEEMDAALLPLLQERRDFETFDDEHPDVDPINLEEVA